MKTVEIRMEWRLIIAAVTVLVGLLQLLSPKKGGTPQTAASLAVTTQKIVPVSSDVCSTVPHPHSAKFECQSSSWYSENTNPETRLDLAAYSITGGSKKPDQQQGMVVRIAALPNDRSQYHMVRFHQNYWVPMKYTLLDTRQWLRTRKNANLSPEPTTVEHTLVSNLLLKLSKHDPAPIFLTFEDVTRANIPQQKYVFSSIDEYDSFVARFAAYSEWLDKESSPNQTAF